MKSEVFKRIGPMVPRKKRPTVKVSGESYDRNNPKTFNVDPKVRIIPSPTQQT